MPTQQIPDKLYFRIGEVAAIVGVKPHVLRYWEEEFPSLRPAKSRSQQRLYRRKEIDFLLALKELLYERGFTIAGVRKRMVSGVLLPPDPPEKTITSAKLLLREVEKELRSLRARLEMPP